MIRILIADDHDIVRQGIRQVLALAGDLEVAGEADSGWAVLSALREKPYQLLLTDLNMPGPNGTELLRRVKEEHPGLAIVVLSMHAERQIAAGALKAGASGYLTKGIQASCILAAVRKVARGGRYIDPELVDKLVFATEAGETELPHERLSEREYQIFQLIVKGISLNDIAEQLHLSAKTVSSHKKRLLQKLEMTSTVELVRYAIQRGMII
ncbi:MAG: response regulator transcription factor [Pseudomonadota bacterium]